jgi:hypothetical protein
MRYKHLSPLKMMGFILLGGIGTANPALSAESGYEELTSNLSPQERMGSDLWFKATGGNKRHHSYVLQQRFGAPIDWYRIFGTQTRGQRFKNHGLITDPDCRPGNQTSYGFDICEGDEELLKFVGKEGYRDPACDLPGSGNWENGCLLEFGTSAGALGFRKFPNPRFKKETWKGWEAYNSHDAAVEPPFLFGTTCGSCHIGFNPKKPPRDPENPSWDNIDGTVGNLFLDNTAIFTSGFGHNSLYWQTLTHVRPGTTDTSAVPNDQIHNSGTFNAIFNFDKRPTFLEQVSRWRRDSATGKWEFSTRSEPVMHVLKGGEDTVGADLAMLRVYVNIGMCSEKCWQNNLMDLRQFNGPGLAQKPFDVAQCRRDCPNWRAMEDRIDSMVAFLLRRRPADLKDAVNAQGERVGEKMLATVKAKYDPYYADEGGVFEAGRKVFARNCASCHSSARPVLPGQPRDESFFLSQDFLKTDAHGVRNDWLGNDERSDASLIGTNRCRSLHTNHNKGHIWEQFSSETFKNSATPSGIPELDGIAGGGRGYYRNISLLSVWADAPFMHNNGIGPEQCSPHFKQEWPCVPADPSVEGRLARYEASMRELLYPETRIEKIAKTTEEIGLKLTFPLTARRIPVPLQLSIPKGTPVGLLGSLDLKQLVNGELAEIQRELEGKSLVQATSLLRKRLASIAGDKNRLLSTLSRYSNCRDLDESKGHTFGAELSDHEKQALIQYMKNF